MRLALADPSLPNTQWNATKTSLFNPKLISVIGGKLEEAEAEEEEQEQEQEMGKFGQWMPKGSQFDVGKFIWQMIQRVRGNSTMGGGGDNGAIANAFTDLIKIFENGTKRSRTNFNQQKESERVVMLCQVSISYLGHFLN